MWNMQVWGFHGPCIFGFENLFIFNFLEQNMQIDIFEYKITQGAHISLFSIAPSPSFISAPCNLASVSQPI